MVEKAQWKKKNGTKCGRSLANKRKSTGDKIRGLMRGSSLVLPGPAPTVSTGAC